MKNPRNDVAGVFHFERFSMTEKRKYQNARTSGGQGMSL